MAKKAKKIMTVELPKAKAPEATDNAIGALMSLQASPGWAIILKILNDNISYLEQAIISKIDPATKEHLTDDEVEILRIKRSLNIDVRDTPQNYTKVISDTGEAPENFDPYYRTNDEILKDRRTPIADEKGA